MKKGWIIFISIVAVIILVLGFFGFVPGLSGILGANKPRDLGVRYTDADLQKGRATTGVELQGLAQGDKSLDFSGNKSISGDYTSKEITAMINGATYKYYPLTRTQVKIHPDGTVETSGNISISKVAKWSNDLGADQGLTNKTKLYLGYVSPNPSFYLKGRISAKDNQIFLDVAEAKVSRFTAPDSIIEEYQGQLADFVEQRIANVPGMKINSATFADGKMKLDATYPAIEKSERKN